MADAPRSKSEAKRLAIQQEPDAPERIWLTLEHITNDDIEYVRADLYEFLEDAFEPIRAKVAALEQERDDNIKLAAKWHARAINARTEGKAQLARLREAIRVCRAHDCRAAYIGPGPCNCEPCKRFYRRALTGRDE